MVPLIRPAALSSTRCRDILACESGNSATISPQIQVVCLAKNLRIAILAGCPSALKILATAKVWSVYVSVLVMPMLFNYIAILR